MAAEIVEIAFEKKGLKVKCSRSCSNFYFLTRFRPTPAAVDKKRLELNYKQIEGSESFFRDPRSVFVDHAHSI